MNAEVVYYQPFLVLLKAVDVDQRDDEHWTRTVGEFANSYVIGGDTFEVISDGDGWYFFAMKDGLETLMLVSIGQQLRE